MPIYEYLCQSCSAETEKRQKLSDAPLSVCPQCGEPQLRRKISAAAFRLKGAGWYETDFKKDGKKNLAGEASAPVAAESSSPATASGSGTPAAASPSASPSPSPSPPPAAGSSASTS